MKSFTARAVNAARQNFGIAPSKQDKLAYISAKLGRPVEEMQGTSRNLFDTQNIALSNAARSTIQFFNNTSKTSQTFSNFQKGQLLSGEALMLEKVTIELLQVTTTDLTSDGNIVTVTGPLAGLSTALSLTGALMTINIANSNVVIDYLINETLPYNNDNQTGLITNTTDDIALFGASVIYLEAPPVLTEANRMTVTLSLPPYPSLGTSVNCAIRMTVGNFGSIFSPKANI